MNKVALSYLLPLIAFSLACSLYFFFVCDDAYISFRYAANLAHGYGLRFNPSDPPIEGYTNFLWVILATLVCKIGLTLDIVMPCISIGFALAIIIFFYYELSNIYQNKIVFFSLITLVTSPTFIIWSSGGLATMPYAFLILSLCYLAIFHACRKPELTVLCALALALIRFEGVFFMLLIMAIAFLANKNFKRVICVTALTLLFYAAYYYCRTEYFHDFFPNTAYMKVDFSLALLKRGFNYAAIFFLTNPVSFLAWCGLIVMFFKKTSYRWSILIIYLALLTYPIVVGGDFMSFSRFYLPLAVFQTLPIAILFSGFKKNLLFFCTTILSFVAFINLFDISPFSQNFLSKFHFRYNKPATRYETEASFYNHVKLNDLKRRAITKALAKVTTPDNSITLTGIGYIGFYSNLKVYDCYGLTTDKLRNIEIKRLRSPGHDKGVKEDFFLSEKPDIMQIKIDWLERKNVVMGQNKKLIKRDPKYSDYCMLDLSDEDFAISLLKRKDALTEADRKYYVDLK